MGSLSLLAALALMSLCACLPVVRNTAGQIERLYVVTGGGGGVAEIDAPTGRVLRTGMAAGDRPWQVAAGGTGTPLVLSLGAGAGRGELGVVGGGMASSGRMVGAYRPIALEPRTSVELLAGDGTGRAVAAYGPRPEGLVGAGRGTAACRLALVDTSTGSVLARRDVCDHRTERVLALALEPMGTASVAYAAVWRVNPMDPMDPSGRGRARLVSVSFAGTAGGESSIGLGAATVATVDGVPQHVLVAPGTGRTGWTGRAQSIPRILTVEADRDGGDAHDPHAAPETLAEHAASWRLVIRHLPQLEIEREVPLPYRPASVAVTPDGSRVYAVAGYLERPGVLTEVDVCGGSAARLHRLPEAAMGLAVTDEWIYVASPGAGSVWQLDRLGRVRRTIPVGKQPIWLATGRG